MDVNFHRNSTKIAFEFQQVCGQCQFSTEYMMAFDEKVNRQIITTHFLLALIQNSGVCFFCDVAMYFLFRKAK